MGCAATPTAPEAPCQWQWVRNSLPNTGIDSLEICIWME